MVGDTTLDPYDCTYLGFVTEKNLRSPPMTVYLLGYSHTGRDLTITR